MTENDKPYKVDGEVGRFEFMTHSGSDDSGETCNTAIDLFPKLHAKAYYRTVGFKQIAMIYGATTQSYREVSELINRIRYQQEDGTPFRTLRHNTEGEGGKIVDYISLKTKQILLTNDFTEEGICLNQKRAFSESTVAILPQEQVRQVAEKIERDFKVDGLLDNPLLYENPMECINIAIDDVNVKKQKEEREKIKSNEDSKRKYVHNTVVHIANKDGHYTLNGYGIKTVLCYVMAFLFNNSLVGKRFQFFTDGHRVLDKTILHHFNWYKNKGIILDWFHLVKKCKEQLSLALNGRLNRNMVLSQIMPLLWVGLTDKAIASLKEVDDSVVKSPKAKEKLIDYLERNRSNIPCYAIRKKLGLQNSSAIGEKMNDLLVSKRQKHNGMSWSKDGSVALASITAIKRNGESKRWFSERELDFKIAA